MILRLNKLVTRKTRVLVQGLIIKTVLYYVTSQVLRNFIQQILKLNPPLLRRQFINDNEIEIDYIPDLKPPPPFLKQEEGTDNSNSESNSESNESDNAAEESVENKKESNSKESESNDASVDDDSDYSDEPLGGGDGQGGGILGLLAGLSGGEDGQSDLGSLLATISGIVANLSVSTLNLHMYKIKFYLNINNLFNLTLCFQGDGIDLNALIASGIGLFVGLLSEGEENPGAVIASYLLTSLDTITGGGSKNNGAFFGTFLSKLVKGSSAAGDPESSEEDGNKMTMADSAGFFSSLIVSLLGNMSKGSSGGSHPW
ncbi:uncharacterized protein [Epargyreus clarus]|uniref:uncharacterized protein n=1 Tax=Epargyreus clarus TaxID=520877 RepID=UPI003C2F70B0